MKKFGAKILVVCAATAALTMALAGTAFAGVFSDNSAGLFPDTFENREMLNLGNRGCNSCHDDLSMVMGSDERPELHAIVKGTTGYGKKWAINECMSCHGYAAGFYAPNLGDIVHNRHYSDPAFTEGFQGNCWSCHATKKNFETGDWDLVLFEDIMYDGTLGGYTDAVTNWKAQEWSRDHGHTDYITGIAVDHEPMYAVEWDQFANSVDDLFVCYNYPPDLLDYEQIWSGDNTLTLTGVNEEKTFTYADLEAMPQTTVMAAHVCTTNGQGGTLVGNFEYTGVAIADLIEACGGLVEGNNMVLERCYDSWEFAHNPLDIDTIIANNGIVALQINGETLKPENGYPYLLVLPGFSAGTWGKWLESLNFLHWDEPFNILTRLATSEKFYGLANDVNSGWYANDGITFNLGEDVVLEGYTWAWGGVSPHLDTISFSTDGGITWFEEAIPADHDANVLSQFTFRWTPTEPGTYIVKCNAVNVDGEYQYVPSSIIVNVVA